MARFKGWLSPNHIPAPQAAFCFLLLIQDLSVWTVIGGSGRPPCRGFCSRQAGSSDILVGLVNTLKDSFILCLAVSDGSKRILSPFFMVAC